MKRILFLVVSIALASNAFAEEKKVTVKTVEGTREFGYSEFSIGVESAKIDIVDENNKEYKLQWESPNHPVADTKFWMITAIHAASMAYDIETTFYTLDRCPNCYEANPIMRPFVKRGRLATYAFGMGIVTAQTWISYEMKKHTKFWWVIPAAGIGLHSYAGTHNLSLTWNKSF